MHKFNEQFEIETTSESKCAKTKTDVGQKQSFSEGCKTCSADEQKTEDVRDENNVFM